MNKSVESLNTISEEERRLEVCRAREKSRMDQLARIAYAERQAKKQGKIEVAEKLFLLDLEMPVIAEITELPIEELNEIEKRVKSEQS